MGVPSKTHNIRLVKIQPEERLAATSERNLASSLVTGYGEAKGMGYWAATQVKGFSPEIHVVSEADVVHLTEGCTLITDSPMWTWRCDASAMDRQGHTFHTQKRSFNWSQFNRFLSFNPLPKPKIYHFYAISKQT
jgi:hypothetical protein